MQSHPLRRTRFGQYQASSAALGTAIISCVECSQVAGLIQKVGGSSLEASSLRAAVLRVAGMHMQVFMHMQAFLFVY